MIQVNGSNMAWDVGLTVRELMVRCQRNLPLVIVSVNDSIIPRLEYDRTLVPDGADVKIILLSLGG